MQVSDVRDRVTPTLKRYHNAKAIVFGSFARGDVSRHSDIDLILIQHTTQRFWDRYEDLLDELNRAMPNLNKAELIEGVVHMLSPVRFKQHGKPHQMVNGWIGMYCAFTPGVESGNHATVRLDTKNEVQPDIVLRLIEGGTSHITPDDFLSGAPELIVEIASFVWSGRFSCSNQTR
ncbi:MAG: Uma2 family endonuclease [Chloroflexi bacterium]|nr:Uma2 family endonuclease [Chloroflexota bacterium]